MSRRSTTELRAVVRERSSAIATSVRRGTRERFRLEERAVATLILGRVVWEKRWGKRRLRGEDSNQRSDQKAVAIPLPIVTEEISLKVLRPATMSFQMRVSR
jgi:hypothetical protein